MNESNLKLMKITAAVGYVAMVAVNYLANALPIGGVTTGQASDTYANLFTPAGVTFSIWGLIYLLLAVYVVFQFGVFGKKKRKLDEGQLAKINGLFLATLLTNISWIFAWHYGLIALSVLLMLVLLVSLIKIADLLGKMAFSKIEAICVRLPFSIYFGWITVATIANITVFLVSLKWDGFGLPEQLWTVVILLVGAGIGIWRMLMDRNVPYGLVVIWAYLGILLKHVSDTGHAGRYPSVIAAVSVSLVLLLVSTIYVAFGKKKPN